MKTTHTPDTLTAASLAELASCRGRPCLSLDWIEDMLAVPAGTQLCLATAGSADIL